MSAINNGIINITYPDTYETISNFSYTIEKIKGAFKEFIDFIYRLFVWEKPKQAMAIRRIKIETPQALKNTSQPDPSPTPPTPVQAPYRITLFKVVVLAAVCYLLGAARSTRTPVCPTGPQTPIVHKTNALDPRQELIYNINALNPSNLSDATEILGTNDCMFENSNCGRLPYDTSTNWLTFVDCKQAMLKCLNPLMNKMTQLIQPKYDNWQAALTKVKNATVTIQNYFESETNRVQTTLIDQINTKKTLRQEKFKDRWVVPIKAAYENIQSNDYDNPIADALMILDAPVLENQDNLRLNIESVWNKISGLITHNSTITPRAQNAYETAYNSIHILRRHADGRMLDGEHI